MTVVTQTVGKELSDLYSGFNVQDVGIGTSATYSSQELQKKKTDKLLIGGMSEVAYLGFEHDREPLIISMAVEQQYNTVLGINLHYVPVQTRQGIIKSILQSNIARIKSNQPLIVDYHDLKNQFQEIQYITRRYKLQGLRVLYAIPLREWDRVIKEPSRWQNHWRVLRG